VGEPIGAVFQLATTLRLEVMVCASVSLHWRNQIAIRPISDLPIRCCEPPGTDRTPRLVRRELPHRIRFRLYGKCLYSDWLL